MDDLAVTRGGRGSERVLAFEDGDRQPGTAERPRDGEADDARADDDSLEIRRRPFAARHASRRG